MSGMLGMAFSRVCSAYDLQDILQEDESIWTAQCKELHTKTFCQWNIWLCCLRQHSSNSVVEEWLQACNTKKSCVKFSTEKVKVVSSTDKD